ncbi:hypothetical protein [Algoriphagus hitonicola]|nr:hypothetical protein [Algoriphagus hitonicola]
MPTEKDADTRRFMDDGNKNQRQSAKLICENLRAIICLAEKDAHCT